MSFLWSQVRNVPLWPYFAYLTMFSSCIVAPDCERALMTDSLSASVSGPIGAGNRALPPPDTYAHAHMYVEHGLCKLTPFPLGPPGTNVEK
jgi:hypothetical protein